MRIIAGAWRGRPLQAPPGQATRPTSDRARETLFSMLQSRLGSFEGLRVADLFAGTGALGLEALSRGAAHCTFVEQDRAAVDTLRKNVTALGAVASADIRASAVANAPPPAQPCHLILMDPPYRQGLAQQALTRIADPAWLAPSAWISVEFSGEQLAAPSLLRVEAERRVGKAQFMLLSRNGSRDTKQD